MTLGSILVTLIGGVFIGVLGKFFAPGDRDNIPLWLTIICGIGGCVLGSFFYGLFFKTETVGIDWWRHFWQIGVAAILVVIAAGATGRSSTKV